MSTVENRSTPSLSAENLAYIEKMAHNDWSSSEKIAAKRSCCGRFMSWIPFVNVFAKSPEQYDFIKMSQKLNAIISELTAQTELNNSHLEIFKNTKAAVINYNQLLIDESWMKDNPEQFVADNEVKHEGLIIMSFMLNTLETIFTKTPPAATELDEPTTTTTTTTTKTDDIKPVTTTTTTTAVEEITEVKVEEEANTTATAPTPNTASGTETPRRAKESEESSSTATSIVTDGTTTPAVSSSTDSTPQPSENSNVSTKQPTKRNRSKSATHANDTKSAEANRRQSPRIQNKVNARKVGK